MRAAFEGATAYLDDGFDDDGDDDRLEAREQSRDKGRIAVRRVDVGEQQQDEYGRDNEEGARNNASRRSVDEPADVDGKLCRLGAGQHHAVVERVQETLFREPTPALDQQ